MRGFPFIPKKIVVLFFIVFVCFSLLEVKTLLNKKPIATNQEYQPIRGNIDKDKSFMNFTTVVQNDIYRMKINNNDGKDNLSKENFDDVMACRIQNMRAACEHHGLDIKGEDPVHQPNPWEYLIAKRDNVNLVWCNIFKSGSSSWMYLFNRLAGYTEKDLKKRGKSPVGLAREKYPRPSVQELTDILSLSNTVGFLIARNPYERLVSGYREKILGAIRGSDHDKLGKEMVVKYRNLDPKLYKYGKTFPTFTEFVNYIVDEANAGHSLDMHWKPVYQFCTPCQVNLNHIIKFETFDRDTLEILSRSVLTEYLPKKEKTLKKNVSKGGKNTSSLVEMYLNELTPDLRMNLYNLYAIDFDILGYEPML